MKLAIYLIQTNKPNKSKHPLEINRNIDPLHSNWKARVNTKGHIRVNRPLQSTALKKSR